MAVWHYAGEGKFTKVSSGSGERGVSVDESIPGLSLLPRVNLGFFPTPIQTLPRLSRRLGREILIKRDDLSGLAMGGNKARKLRFLVAEAIAQECDTLIATGFLQSNNVVQTAAAAARCGLKCILALEAHRPGDIRGNVLLSNLLGAEIRYAGDRPIREIIDGIKADVAAMGGKAYAMPPGGSTGIGVAGFVEAAVEARAQLREMGKAADVIVLATGTGGTQAGLLLGSKILDWPIAIVGISTGKSEEELQTAIPAMAAESACALGVDCRIESREVIVSEEYIGEGYARPGLADFEAIRTVARQEGILTDPVYTGRAMHGMIDLLKRGRMSVSGPILFWHTGGLPAVFSFDEPGNPEA